MDQRLIRASQQGNTDELYGLLEENGYLLERIDQIPFIDTPLHIAASAGHVEFALEVINLKPSFARKLSPSGFTPMHLALQNRQFHMVLQLLKINQCLVRVKGKKGITPLHHVTGEGDTELLSDFLVACPESIKEVTVRNETALHVAVVNNRLEALEVLVGWIQRTARKGAKYMEHEVVNWQNNDGNTALHLAAERNQQQACFLNL